MQKYTDITEETTIKESRKLFLDNDKTIASHFSGTEFPMDNLIVGMECYRTDENRKYRLTSLSPVKWEPVLSTSDIAKIKVDAAVHADTAGNADTTDGKHANDAAGQIALKDGSNDLNCRLLRATYANQNTISGAIAFRINNTSDNYTRYCSDAAAIRTFLGLGNVNNTADSAKSVNYATSAGTATNANKLGGLALAGARNNAANQVVRTDGNGYAQFGWINTTSGAIGSINKIYCSNDDYIRYMTVANFKTALGINNVENTADANKNVNTAKLLRPNTLTGANAADIVYAQMADNDYFRIRIGGTGSNAGYAEIATADDGTEPIYVRQYTGVFSSLTRTATLLDGSGNTSFPGTVTASSFNDTAANANKLIGMNWHWSGQGGQPTWLWVVAMGQICTCIIHQILMWLLRLN